MDHPTYTEFEARTRTTFLALMWALSHPGQPHQLPVEDQGSFMLIGETLLDLETSFYTPDDTLNHLLAHTGARVLTPERAAYHFYPVVDDTSLAYIRVANVGTMLYPDQSATLVMGCTFGSGAVFTLNGPGIKDTQSFTCDGLPDAFWKLREQAGNYPLGWDTFLVDHTEVIGIPRTTTVSRE